MNQSKKKRLTQYRIVHIMYIIAVLASSMALFVKWGAWGVVPGTLGLLFWVPVYLSENRAHAFFLTLFVFVSASLFILLAVRPTLSEDPEHSRRWICDYNKGKLGAAFAKYEADNKSFPPAFIADEEGTPMHSWRVLLLPYLGEQALYEKYDYHEPWNGPNNIKLLDQMPDVYACPSAHYHNPGDEFCTNFVAIVGSDTMWSSELIEDKSKLTDDLKDTLLLAEFDDTRIPWLQPNDLEYNEAVQMLSSQDPDTHRVTHPHGRMLLMSDGNSRFINSYQPEEYWKGIIGINDGINWESLEVPYDSTQDQPSKLIVILQVVMFMVLLIIPMGGL